MLVTLLVALLALTAAAVWSARRRQAARAWERELVDAFGAAPLEHRAPSGP